MKCWWRLDSLSREGETSSAFIWHLNVVTLSIYWCFGHIHLAISEIHTSVVLIILAKFQFSIFNSQFKYRALHISYSIAPLFWVSKIVFTKVSPNWTARSNESFSINFSIQINTVWTFWRKLNRRTWINISQYHLPPLPQSYKKNKSDTIYKAKLVPEADLIWRNFTKQKQFQRPTKSDETGRT